MKGHSFNVESVLEPAAARALLASFFAKIHRPAHPYFEWEERVMCYVSTETEDTVERLLHELRQIETRLLINMHRLGKTQFFQNSEPAEAQDFSYKKWIHDLVEIVEMELKSARERQSAITAEERGGEMKTMPSGLKTVVFATALRSPHGRRPPAARRRRI